MQLANPAIGKRFGQFSQEDLLLELRQEYMAMGLPVCTDFGLYLFDSKELVFEQRTMGSERASKAHIDAARGRRCC